jgi:hypothetical protein
MTNYVVLFYGCHITTKVHQWPIDEYRNNMEPYRISKHSCFVLLLLLMPGANCSIFGCNTSRKTTAISIFVLPKGEDELSRKTHKEWLRQIKRNRVIDQDLRWQIEVRTVHICKKHFEGKVY